MATELTAQDVLEFKKRRAAPQGAAITAAPQAIPEDTSIMDTLGKTFEHQATILATQLTGDKDLSNYGKQRAKTQAAELKAIQRANEARGEGWENVVPDIARYGTVGLAALAPVPFARVGAASLAAGMGAGDILQKQHAVGGMENVDLESAAYGGGAQGLLELATAGTAGLVKAPIKGYLARRAGDAVAGAGSEAISNVSAGAEQESLGTAALASAAFGAAGEGVAKALGKKWRGGAERDMEDTGKVLTSDFSDAVRNQEQASGDLRTKLANAQSSEEVDAIIEEIKNLDMTEAAAMNAVARGEESGVRWNDQSFDVKLNRGFSGTGGKMNLREKMGITQEEADESGEILRNAANKRWGKDDREFTRTVDEEMTQQSGLDAYRGMINSQKDNVQMVKDMGEGYKGLADALDDLRKKTEGGSEGEVLSAAGRALKEAYNTGMLDKLKGSDGKAGNWDPLFDAQSTRSLGQMLEKRLPGIFNITPDTRKRSSMDPSAANDLLSKVPGGTVGKNAVKELLAGRKQAALKESLAKTKERTKALSKIPKKPISKEIVDELPDVEVAIKDLVEEIQSDAGSRALTSRIPPDRRPQQKPSDEPQAAPKVKTQFGTDIEAQRAREAQRASDAERDALAGELQYRTGISEQEAKDFMKDFDVRGEMASKGKPKPTPAELRDYVENKFNESQAAKAEEGEAKGKTLAQRLEEQRTLREERYTAADERAKKLREQASARQSDAKKAKENLVKAESDRAKSYLERANDTMDFESLGLGPKYRAFINAETNKRTMEGAVDMISQAEGRLQKLAAQEQARYDEALRTGGQGDQVVEEAGFKQKFARFKEKEAGRAKELEELKAEVAEQNRILKEREDEAAKAGEESRIADDELEAAKKAPESDSAEVVEEIKALPAEALPGAAKAGLSHMATTGDESIVDAVVTEMDKKGMDKEAAVVKQYKTILKRVAERRGVMKKTGGVDDRYLLSHDERSALQEEISGGKISSYMGKMGKDLSAAVYGWNDKAANMGLPSAEVLKEFMKKRREMLKAGTKATKAPSGKFRRGAIAPGKK